MSDHIKLDWTVTDLHTNIAILEAQLAELAAENERLKREVADANADRDRWYESSFRAEALASTGAVKAPSDEIDEVIASLEYWAERLADIRQPQGQTALIYAASILSALEPHPRATNTVVSHETANVSDKPEGQQEPVAWFIRAIGRKT